MAASLSKKQENELDSFASDIVDSNRDASPSRKGINEKKLKELMSMKKRNTVVDKFQGSFEKPSLTNQLTLKPRDDLSLKALRTYVVINPATVGESPLKVRLEASPTRKRGELPSARVSD